MEIIMFNVNLCENPELSPCSVLSMFYKFFTALINVVLSCCR